MTGYIKNVDIENIISNIVIPSIFPLLNNHDRDILSKYTNILIIIISLLFSADESFEYQLKQNDYQDIKWLIYHLLPFLNEQNNIKNIRSFNDIYIKKKKDININLTEPEYLYSNIQYNRCIRNENNYEERQFNIDDLKHNFYLLLDTLKTMSNKMHVNWIDILPYTTEDYINSSLFQSTSHIFKNNKITDWDPVKDIDLKNNMNWDDLIDKMTCLQTNDIYNSIMNDFYRNIKDIKWLIYDIIYDGKMLPGIWIMKILFPNEIIACLDGTNWFNLDKNIADNFRQKWEKLVHATINGEPYGKLSNKYCKLLLKGIILFFDRSADTDIFDSGYIKINININEREEEENEHENITFWHIKSNLLSADPRHIYDFIYDCLNKFKTTWYGNRLLNNEKTDISNKNPIYINDIMPITYKHIYNFCKSLTHYTENDNYIEYPIQWRSLTIEQKDEILKRLNNEYNNEMDWFNISNNIALGYSDFIGNNNVKIINKNIHNEIRRYLHHIIFDNLIKKGVLTRFIPNKLKTNNEFTTRENIYKLQKDIMNPNSNNKYWVNAYHYLTRTAYSNMKSFQVKDGNMINNYNYFTFGLKNPWYSAYAYDWIAQIGFCHHFVNNRIIFITGATGVGKSTEIPKLFMYYSIAIDYLNAPKIICTQPRKDPAQSNAVYVAKALGLPVFNADNTDSPNYYIQIRHKDRTHYKTTHHASLEYATDGTLILQVKDQIMKKMTGQNENEKYTLKNIYDVIMIDEAHEHKINMDMLLTLLKSVIGYNNSMRLIILSATMDEDEPRYRRYYRDINDNKKYPLDEWIVGNEIDRINVDRRYHISPPGFGTKFKVEDIYVPNDSISDVTLKILNSSTIGDILIFQPGLADINKLVIELNKIIPSNVIAIPYHGKLSNDIREFIKNINVEVKNLRIDKNIDINTITNVNQLSMGSNYYNRVIIIATNVAEASITIPSLKFVIETGNQKVNYYDYKKKGEKLIKMDISESSRIQRRGRVGRKSSGTVYYLYEKGKMEYNKTAYEISTSDITMILFQKLRMNNDEKIFMDSKYDMNSYKTNITMIPQKFIENGLEYMIKKQYYNGKNYYQYYGKDIEYDYKYYNSFPKFYETGYDYDTLNDEHGTFYLIHPNELDIKRNINGDIVGIKNNEIDFIKDDKYKGYIKSKKMISFWRTLHDYWYVSGLLNNMVKTKFGNIIIELIEKLKIENYDLFRSIIFGIVLNCGSDMIKLYNIYSVLNFNVLSICKMETVMNKKNMPILIYKTDKVKGLVNDKSSDSNILLDILKLYHEYLRKIDLPDNLEAVKYLKLLDNSRYTYEDYYDIFKTDTKYIKTDTNYIRSESSFKISKKNKTEIIESLKKIQNDEINKKLDMINEWCSERGLDTMKMVEYIKQYSMMRLLLSEHLTNQIINILKELSSIMDIPKNINPITLSLLFGYVSNVCKKIDESNYYLSLYSMNTENLYQIASLSQYKFVPNSFVDMIYTENYLLYLSLNIENDSISCLQYIDPDTITILANVYNKKYFMEYKHDTYDKEYVTNEFINNRMAKYNETYNNKFIDVNTQHASLNYSKTIKQIIQDMINSINKNKPYDLTNKVIKN